MTHFEQELSIYLKGYRRHLVSYILRKLRCTMEEAEDVLQDGIESALRWNKNWDGLNIRQYFLGVLSTLFKQYYQYGSTYKYYYDRSKTVEFVDYESALLFNEIKTINPIDIIYSKEIKQKLLDYASSLKFVQRESIYVNVFDMETNLSQRQINTGWYNVMRDAKELKWKKQCL